MGFFRNILYLKIPVRNQIKEEIKLERERENIFLVGLEVMIQSKQGNKQLFGAKNKENNYKKQQKRRNINLVTLFTITGNNGGKSSVINLINQQGQKETPLINGMEKVGV